MAEKPINQIMASAPDAERHGEKAGQPERPAASPLSGELDSGDDLENADEDRPGGDQEDERERRDAGVEEGEDPDRNAGEAGEDHGHPMAHPLGGEVKTGDQREDPGHQGERAEERD